MAKEDNLKPIQKGQLSKDELKKRQSNGGKKSGEIRTQKRLLKDTIEMMLKLQPTPQMVNECAEKFGFNPKDLQDIITGGLINKAMSGDSRAFEVLRDTVGQKPKEEVINTNLNTDATIEELKSYFEQ